MQSEFVVKTSHPYQMVDLTDRVRALLREADFNDDTIVGSTWDRFQADHDSRTRAGVVRGESAETF